MTCLLITVWLTTRFSLLILACMKHTLLVALLTLMACTSLLAQNPIIRDVFTADPAPLVYHDTLFLYTGHDTASVSETNYKMPDWRIYSTTDMVH